MRRIALVTLAGLTILAPFGCAHRSARLPTNGGEVVERSARKPPKWARIPFQQTRKYVYFSGQVGGVGDPALGMRQAKANAVQNLVESLDIGARSEFSELTTAVQSSSESVERYVDSMVEWTTDRLGLMGLVVVNDYWERVSIPQGDGALSRYNCYVRLRLPREEYARARQRSTESPAGEVVKGDERDMASGAGSGLE